MRYIFAFVFYTFILNQGFSQSQKLFVYTDRELYAPGDTIWYNVYLIDILSGTYAKTNDIVHLYLKNDVWKRKQMIRLQNGFMNAQLVIPKNTKSGMYTLSAYTSYIRSFGKGGDFIKNIKVQSATLAGGMPVAKINPEVKPQEVKSASDVLQFFPESGKYFPGFSCKIGFKVNLSKKDLKGGKGIVFDQNGKEISSFYPDFNGLGNFSILAERDQKFKAVFKTKTKSFEADLPPLSTEGYCLNIDNVMNKNSVFVTIYSMVNTTDTIKFYAHQNHHTVFQRDFVLDNSQIKFPLTESIFETEGLARLFILNTRNELLAERYIFISKEKKYYVEPQWVQTKVGAIVKENLELNLKDADDEPMTNIPLTLAINRPQESINANTTFKTFYHLSSEIPDLDVNIDSLYSLSETNMMYGIDNILLVYKPSSIVRQFTNTQSHEEYLRIQPKVLKGTEILPQTSIKVFVKSPFTLNSYILKTDDSSRINLSGIWYDTLVIFAMSEDKKPLNLVFTEEVYPFPKISSKQGIPVIKAQTTQVVVPPVKKPVGVGAKPTPTRIPAKVPAKPNVLGSIIPKTDFRRKFYKGIPDVEVYLKSIDDTTKSLVNILEENLTKEKMDTASQKRILGSLFTDKAVYWVDGQQVTLDFINLLEPKEVVLIDIVHKKENIRSLGRKEGQVVFNVLSKDKKVQNSIFSKYNAIKYASLVTTDGFKSRNRTVVSNQTIYWASNIVTDKEGKIKVNLGPYNKLLPYRLRVLGIDSKGEVIEWEGKLR
ncbi:MAG: MG2 domain-containing protein [Leadbetterella sp.]